MKKIWKAAVFCLILAFLLTLINKILMPDTDFHAEPIEQGEEVDYLMLGTSNVFYCINPAVIWNEKGYVGYDLSTQQAPLIVSYYQLKEELEKVNPKTVYLECAAFEYNYGIPSMNQLSLDKMDLNFNKIELICKLGEDDENHNIATEQTYDKLNYVIPLVKFHGRWKEAFEGTLYSKYHDVYEHVFMGYVATKDNYVYEKDYKWLPTLEEFGGSYMTEVTDLNREYFYKIRELCDGKGIELKLIKTPSKGWVKEMSDSMKQFAQEENIVFVDMNDEGIIQELNIDEKKDFCDSSSHFNVYGTEKISKWIADYMQQEDSYEDKRIQGTPVNAKWNDVYLRYTEYRDQG